MLYSVNPQRSTGHIATRNSEEKREREKEYLGDYTDFEGSQALLAHPSGTSNA
jgi:hypothetical protein